MFPLIAPPLQLQNRPRWSVMIPTYNSSSYLEETLMSVLAQDPGADKMQIEIVDDCSQGNAALDTLNKLGLAERVGYYRQAENMGLARNWNTCIQRAQGEIVHILHQDDMVLPGFYTELEKAFLQQPSIGAAYCRYYYIDEMNNVQSTSSLESPDSGIIPDWLERIAVRQLVQTPAIVVRRSVYEKLGGFHPGLLYALDWEMWVRIAAIFPVWYEPQTLAAYRRHSQSETAHLEKSGETIRDILRFYQIRRGYLPNEFADRTERKSRQGYSQFAFRNAFKLFNNHEICAGFILIYHGLRLKTNFQTSYTLFKMTYKFIARHIKANLRRFVSKSNSIKI